jgi:hypothetical protein
MVLSDGHFLQQPFLAMFRGIPRGVSVQLLLVVGAEFLTEALIAKSETEHEVGSTAYPTGGIK